MDFVDKSLSSEISYPMSILLSAYMLREKSTRNGFKWCCSSAAVSCRAINKTSAKENTKRTRQCPPCWSALLIANWQSVAQDGDETGDVLGAIIVNGTVRVKSCDSKPVLLWQKKKLWGDIEGYDSHDSESTCKRTPTVLMLFARHVLFKMESRDTNCLPALQEATLCR